jgi:OOP family OmpA-OmpF porin
MSMKRRLVRAALLGAALALSAPAAFAQAQGLYIGGSIGQAQADGFCDSEPGFTVTSCDDKDTGWKAFVGYRVNRNFAVEGSYMNGGELGGTVNSFFGTGTVKTDVTAWGIAALGILPVSERVELFGKLGFVRGESDSDVSVNGTPIPSDDDSGTELAYGFGAVFNLTRSLGIRAEWENIDDADISMLSIGIQYKFQ